VLYVGPERSHISDALENGDAADTVDGRRSNYIRFDFGDVTGLTDWLEADWRNWKETGRRTAGAVLHKYSQKYLLPQLVQIIEDRT
jgi:hypothetical protein